MQAFEPKAEIVATREEEQAVSMLTDGPFKPSVKEIRPQTTDSVPDVAVYAVIPKLALFR